LRRAVNTAGQGSCGDVLKLALKRISDASRNPHTPLNKLNCQILCPVFDAVLLELDEGVMKDEETRKAAEKVILEQMEVVLNYEGRSTKMKASVGWSKNSWGEACGK